MKAKRNAFTLVEILIVVVIMAVLAATIIPQFTASTKDAQESTVIFNLQALRSQVEMYKAQHNGNPPTTLDLLTKKTSATHSTTTNATLGPYLLRIPENPFNNQVGVGVASSDPPAAAGGATDGWLYNATSGKVYISHSDYLLE